MANGRLRIEPIRPQDVMLRPLPVTATGRSGTTLLMHRPRSVEIVLADLFPFEIKLLTYYGGALVILTTASGASRRFRLDQLKDRYHLGLNPFHHPDFKFGLPERGDTAQVLRPAHRGAAASDVPQYRRSFRFLAVSRGLKRRPLASAGGATQLMAFLCSAERGRFFVPA